MTSTDVEKVLGHGGGAVDEWRGEVVLLEDQKILVRRVGSGRLRMVQFKMNGRVLEALEQNREKPSRWGSWRGKTSGGAVSGCGDTKYVAVAVDREVTSMGSNGEYVAVAGGQECKLVNVPSAPGFLSVPSFLARTWAYRELCVKSPTSRKEREKWGSQPF